jgi:pilus assembly protein CpaC
MKTQIHKTRIYTKLLYTALLAAFSVTALAQERVVLQASFANNAQPFKIDVLVGQSRVVEFDQPYDRVSVSDNKIAEVVPVSERQVLINGLSFGQVNIVAWAKRPANESPKMLVFDIYVQVNLSLIDNQIKILFPKENIQLSQVNNSVVLSGSVTKPELAEQVQKIVEATGLKVNNLIKAPILDAAQVQLQIRVAEVNRRVLREVSTAFATNNSTVPSYVSASGPAQFGGYDVSRNYNQDAGGFVTSRTLTTLPSTALNLFLGTASGNGLAYIRALQTRGAIRELAEPNLIAMHGHKASFLAGGEFPIPVIQSINQGQSAITVIFKEFGVKLNFQPTILDENHIRLELEPEVSSLDFGAGVTLQGLTIPGLRVRRAKTVLELRDGQSFALAGLIDNTEQVNLSKIPVLADIPILGELFKSRSFQRNETELMFLVTVKTVEPLNPDQLPKLPGVSELKPSSPAPAMPTASIEGQAGHAMPAKNNPPNPTPEQPLVQSKPVKNESPELEQPPMAQNLRPTTTNNSLELLPAGLSGTNRTAVIVGQSPPSGKAKQ